METEDPAIKALREKMEREDDIKRVVRLIPHTEGRYLYLIETPFATFPKFVIGSTDATFDDVRLLSRCGLLQTAETKWLEIIDPDGTREDREGQ